MLKDRGRELYGDGDCDGLLLGTEVDVLGRLESGRVFSVLKELVLLRLSLLVKGVT